MLIVGSDDDGGLPSFPNWDECYVIHQIALLVVSDDAGQHTLAVVHIAQVGYTDISCTPLNCRSRYIMASRRLAMLDIPEPQPKV